MTGKDSRSSVHCFRERVKSVIPPEEAVHGEISYNNCDCQILAQSAVSIDFLVHTAGEDEAMEYSLLLEGDGNNLNIIPECNGERPGWNRFAYACLLQYESELALLDSKEPPEHKRYTRQGMIKRVLEERRLKADKAKKLF